MPLSSEAVSLESLVHHRGSVPHDLPLEELHRVFRERDVDYLALLRDGTVSGLASRSRLGFLMGSRFGFALYARSPAHMVQVEHPYVFNIKSPVRKMLDSALARQGEEFHEDVILVDETHQLLGLIHVEALTHLQRRLVAEQLTELRRQHDELQRQHVELFQTNHALRQTQGLYQGLFESNALGVVLLDPHGTVQAHNRRLTELLNLGEGPVALFSLVKWVSEREQMIFESLLREQERGNAMPSTHEFHLEVPGRGTRLFHFSTGWIRETSQICMCLDDITEQRSLERHMQRQEKQRLLDTLVGGIAHELNNKLTPVLGFAELLEPGADPSGQAHINYIRKSVTEASNIIRQLLQLSKPATGNPQRVDLGEIVDETMIMLKFQLRERRTVARLVTAPDPVMVQADPGQIKQVLMNLALNALQAMEHTAAPVLGLETGRRGDKGYITVTDNGTGISPEILERIFDPFFTTKRPDRGTGLGLSISYSIVRQHGGDLSVESEPGKGARFTLTLPLAQSELQPVALFQEPTKPAVVSGLGGGRRRVLVVEDEDVVRKLLQELLRTLFGCTVDCAANGVEALRFTAQSDYDLVVSDIRMPEMNGPEFYLRLRETRPAQTRRFLFVTGYAGEKNLEDEISRWGVPVLAKPFTVAKLTAACAPFFESASTRSAPVPA